jgi:hypothetical protein
VAAWIAECKYCFFDSLDESLEASETILTQEFKANLGPALFWQHQGYLTSSAEHFPPHIYLQKATDAHKSRQDPSEWVDKLRSMSVNVDSTAEAATVTYRDNLACTLLGVYYRQKEGAERSKWMPCFRHRIQGILDILESGEHVLYQSVFAGLGNLLLLAGDITNAATAHSISVLYWEYCNDPKAQLALSELGFTTY